MNLTTATPVEIDTIASAAYQAKARFDRQIEIAEKRLQSDFSATTGPRFRETYTDSPITCIERARDFVAGGESKPNEFYTQVSTVQHTLDELGEALAAQQEQQAILEAVDAEFQARGGWTRAFLVTNVNGHVHSSMHCSTCRYTTQYHWVVELSDHNESEIVDAAGSDACTVCYPSAPLDRPRSIFTPDEEQAKKDREERAAAKAEREAKKLAKSLFADGSAIPVSRYEKISTVVQAKKFLTDDLESAHYGWGRKDPELVTVIADALAAKEGKTVEVVMAEAEKRAANRRR